jgi:class 3 adenylate cyclase
VAIQRVVSQEFEFDLRIGVHADGALQRERNYHGKGVHAAARIGAVAQGGEILASHATVASLRGYRTQNPRAVRLKGFKEPVEVCSVIWES